MTKPATGRFDDVNLRCALGHVIEARVNHAQDHPTAVTCVVLAFSELVEYVAKAGDPLYGEKDLLREVREAFRAAKAEV